MVLLAVFTNLVMGLGTNRAVITSRLVGIYIRLVYSTTETERWPSNL